MFSSRADNETTSEASRRETSPLHRISPPPHRYSSPLVGNPDASLRQCKLFKLCVATPCVRTVQHHLFFFRRFCLRGPVLANASAKAVKRSQRGFSASLNRRSTVKIDGRVVLDPENVRTESRVRTRGEKRRNYSHHAYNRRRALIRSGIGNDAGRITRRSA